MDGKYIPIVKYKCQEDKRKRLDNLNSKGLLDLTEGDANGENNLYF